MFVQVIPSVSLFSSHLRLLVSQYTQASQIFICTRITVFFCATLVATEVIYHTRETVFHQEESWNYDALRNNFDEIRGVWIADETLSRVFDKYPQSKQKLRSKRRSKIVKIYDN